MGAAADLVLCAIAYALPPERRQMETRAYSGAFMSVPGIWPRSPGDWEPGDDRLSDLKKAAEFLDAEIHRLEAIG